MRNVVLIILDSVRKDVFDDVASKLRSRADIEYNQCRAASTWSVPSHASILTGELPHVHNIHTYSRYYDDLNKSNTFIGQLSEHRAVGVSANVFASEPFGFDRLFDSFVSISSKRRFPSGLDVTKFGLECEHDGVRKHLSFVRSAFQHDYPLQSLANGAHVFIDDISKRLPVLKPFDDGARSVVRTAEQLVFERDNSEPFFLFMNVMDAHGPLTPTWRHDTNLFDVPYGWTSEDIDWKTVIESQDEEQLENYVELYKSAIDYLDRVIDSFIDRVQEETVYPTTFVVTSDHGENLGNESDDFLFGHSDSSLTEGLLHTPLVIINPPDEVDYLENQYLSHVDIGELLVALATDSYLDVTREAIAAERIGSDRPYITEGPTARCVYRDQYKYYWDTDGETRRFQLDRTSPSHQKLIDESVPVTELESQFFSTSIETAHENAMGERTDSTIDAVTERRLKDLGYM